MLVRRKIVLACLSVARRIAQGIARRLPENGVAAKAGCAIVSIGVFNADVSEGRALSSLCRFVGVFEVDAEVAVNPGVAMDAEAEALLGYFIENAFSEFNDVFLKGFVAGGIVQYFAYNSGIARA